VLKSQVWWAARGDVRPGHVRLLDAVEHGRRDRYLRAEDRDRFTIGVALTRLVLGEALDVPPERVPLDRTCPDCDRPHGAPRLPGGTGPYVSISHSGDRIALAVSTAGPLGVDVEAARGELDREVAGRVLGSAEVADLERLGPARRQSGLLAYWTRKEAVVKATGDGLRVPLTDLHVSAPDEGPRLLAWRGRPGLPGRFRLHALDPGPGYAACLALIDQPDATVEETPATALLAE
jgi:4'-phosphopantetheinyl transferase